MSLRKNIDGFLNKYLPSNEEKKEIKNAAIKLAAQIKREHSLYKKEIAYWKMARAAALDAEMPRRHLLQYLYDDIMVDAFIYGKWENRKLRISNRKIQVLSDGKLNDEKTALLNTLWFNKFIKHYIDSRSFGYNAIYPKTLDDNGYIKEIATVYRTNIVPETCEILKTTGDQHGQKFNEAPLSDWVLFFGDTDDLGILDKAAPLWIFKKHSWQNWDEFEEMFGIPIRIAKLASEDKSVQNEVKNWLKTLGSAAYGMFPQGTEIEILENKGTDAFNVFNEKRKAANEELAILIDGQFESSVNSGSRAKSETVIENTQHEITEDDANMTLFAINEVLIPFLIKRGYPFAEGDEVVWNDNKETDPAERLKIFEGVKRLGYKVKKEQVASELDVDIEDLPEQLTPAIPKNGFAENFKMPHNHIGCGAHLETYRLINLDVIDGLTPDEIALLRRLWKERDSVNWSYNEFRKNHGDLLNAMRSGYGEIDYDFESTDHITVEAFQNNIHRFGVDKTQKEILDLNKIIKDPTVKTAEQFYQRAKKVFPNYKRIWAQTEWEQAQATSQAAATYKAYMDNIDIAPFWQYKTVGDGRVRPEHRALHNKVFRKDDARAWTFLPPNGYKCRCDDVELIDWDGEVSTLEDAIAADPDGFDKMKKSGHAVNWGNQKEVFTASQSYLNNLPIERLDYFGFNYKTFGLKPVSTLIKRHAIGEGTFSFETFKDRSGFARLDSAENLPVWLEKETADVIDGAIIHKLPEVIKTPDELYVYLKDGVEVKSYFKHYKDGSLNALVSIKEDTIAKITAFVKLDNPDEWRKGLLVWSPKLHLERQLNAFNGFSDDYVKDYFNADSGGFVVVHKERLSSKSKSKRERLKFEKEHAIASKLADEGHSIVMLEELDGVASADITFNGTLADLKETGSHNNILKYAKYAVHVQKAKMVVFHFTKKTPLIEKEITKLEGLDIKAAWYFNENEALFYNYK